MTLESSSNPLPKPPRHRLPEFLQVPWGLADVVLFVGLWLGIQVGISALLLNLQDAVPLANQMVQAIQGDSVVASFALSLLNTVVGFGVLAFILHRRHASFQQLGWRRVSLVKTILYLGVIFAVFLAAVTAAFYILTVVAPGFDANEAQSNTLTNGVMGEYRWAAFIALVILPPIFEESLFRGFLFPVVAKRFGLVGGAIVASLVFGIAHFQANITVYTFLLGLLLCFMYVRLRSIVPGVLLHMINNYLAFMNLGQK